MNKMPRLNKIVSRISSYNKVLVVLIVTIWVGVLAASNYANHQNLVRNELKKNMAVLEDGLRLLNAESSQLQTTSRVEDESKRLELVKIDARDIIYVDTSEDQFALR